MGMQLGAASLNDIAPQMVADVTLYPTAHGGRRGPTPAEWFGCPCKVHKDDKQAWDCRMLLNGQPLKPGETRRLGLIFLSGEKAAALLAQEGKFYLWEGGIIGEATPVQP